MDSKQRCLEKLGCGPAHYDTQNLLTLWSPITIKFPQATWPGNSNINSRRGNKQHKDGLKLRKRQWETYNNT